MTGDDTKVRPRKPVTAARIEVILWFADAAAYEKFARVPFGPKATTISQREWVEAWDHGERGVTARFQFTHTCRNAGAQVSDTKRFFNTTANASGLVVGEADVIEVALVSRDGDVPQANIIERMWTLPPDFYSDPRRNPELAG